MRPTYNLERIAKINDDAERWRAVLDWIRSLHQMAHPKLAELLSDCFPPIVVEAVQALRIAHRRSKDIDLYRAMERALTRVDPDREYWSKSILEDSRLMIFGNLIGAELLRLNSHERAKLLSSFDL